MYKRQYYNVLKSLEPFSRIEKSGLREYHERNIRKKLGNRSDARAKAKEWICHWKSVVEARMQSARLVRRKVSLGADAWKCENSTKKKHYVVTHAWYIDADWSRQSLCLDARELPAERAPRRGGGYRMSRKAPAYVRAFQPGLESVRLEKSGVLLMIW